MTPDDAFLQAIIAAPDDDSPRLAYADYLDEQGRPDRAEFIRIQIDLARLPKGDGRRTALAARERALLEEYAAEWAGPLPRVVLRWEFERGFVAGVEMPVKGFSQLPAIFAEAPLVRLLQLDGPFKYGKPSVQDIVTSPHLARLKSFALNKGYYSVGPDAVAMLAGAPHVRNLTALELRENALGAGVLAVLAESPHLSGLTRLAVSWYGFRPNEFPDLGQVAAFAASPHLTRLEELALCRCGLGDAACEVLSTAPNLAGVRRLHLPGNVISPTMRRQLQDHWGDRVTF
jgi:uncharacterized protein (TIGR02996 family)